MGGGFVSPTEFWNLPPGQVWWIIEDNQPEQFEQPTDVEAIRRMVKKAKETEQHG